MKPYFEHTILWMEYFSHLFFSTWKKSLYVFSWADTFSFILANSLLQIFVRGTDKLSILKSQSKVDIKAINTGLSFCALYGQVPKQNYFIGTSWTASFIPC